MSTSWRITVRATVAAASGGCCRSASITRTQAPRAKRVPATTAPPRPPLRCAPRSEEHTSELQSRENLVCRLLLEKKKKEIKDIPILIKKLSNILYNLLID